VFSHGFTTRHDGHGFGLHGSALAAREDGGSLNAHMTESDGRNLCANSLSLRPTTDDHAEHHHKSLQEDRH
jgi:hypothetical protein